MSGIRRPNINAPTTDGQLEQIKSYLYQLTNQLNFAIKATENPSMVTGKDQDGNDAAVDANAEKTFFKIKDLIIKSADIVTAYYEVISKRLSGQYVAVKGFEKFQQDTNARFEATSTNITQHYESIQAIKSDVANLNELRKDNCYIKTGWLDDNETIAGVEIGKVSEVDGETRKAFAQFTTDKLLFLDDAGGELASFSDYRLYVRIVVVREKLQFEGGYILDPTNGLAFKWGG